ncbi:conserved protein of unknown function [Blastococcus saxobsidens DD2]|uniref:Superfamily II DNA or RNA helicase n=2 Tax=Blastococcus saxobsidens TaxID=138336 RepID=H6RTV5_BLASD|nr:conserved protein of unknown function [Blastococcus saxobsidens DD2]
MAMSVSKDPWKPDVELVREVQNQFAAQIAACEQQPRLIEEQANHEESIRTGGYAHRTLLELVQNAADALAGATDLADEARVEIVLDPRTATLYCANSGRPFSKSGITAVTMAYLSGKRGDEIGRFGLGFKSVLAVTDAPQVFSRSVSFEFNSAEAKAALRRIAPAARRLPVLRTATLIDAAAEFDRDPVLADLATWASTVVKLPRVTDIQRLEKEIQEFRSEFLLFVSAVREVRLRVLGEGGFTTSHVSRDLGAGNFKIERPDGSGDEWLVEGRMHSPSAEARKEVGEAVSRQQIKVTVALPRSLGNRTVGQFWSYFPLQDQTTASGLFNAPWSVNDDRTTMLSNDYNQEILETLSEIFVDLLPRLSTAEDPAGHLDYMPARGRELRGFGDEHLTQNIPRLAAGRALVPDAHGTLAHPRDLRPLDFEMTVREDVHRAWSISPNTGSDVPHFRCYASPTRTTRLRDLVTLANLEENFDARDRDLRKALETAPKRGLLSWLREWAEGSDPVSAANAFRVAVDLHGKFGVDKARVIPTSDGLRSLADKDVVFLANEDDLEVEGAVFVDPGFLAQAGVRAHLTRAGFRGLDAQAILNARLARLSDEDDDEALTKLWDAVLDLPTRAAVEILGAQAAKVRVPTRNGSWASPARVFDVEGLVGPRFDARMLDRGRCQPDVADQLGVVREPQGDYLLEDEPAFEQYRAWVLDSLNRQLGPGERAIENVEFSRTSGPGPVSMLLMLEEAGAAEALRESWTLGLLALPDHQWICEDLATNRDHEVPSPAQWAIDRAGLVPTSRGRKPPADAVAPSMVRYDGLLPLFKGPSALAERLKLPRELDAVPARIFEQAVEADLFPPTLSDAVLAEFTLAAAEVAFTDRKPPRIPARIRKAVESRQPNTVYLAVSDEQAAYLASKDRPSLQVTEDQADRLVARVGCRRFEDSFSFSMQIEGQLAAEPLLDVFTGLRNTRFEHRLLTSTLSRAGRIAKRVTTEEGVEDQSLAWFLDGVELVVDRRIEDRRLLEIASQAFGLSLNNADISSVLQAGLDRRLAGLREEAKAAPTDADRLDVYFGPDDLRDALPKGLWQALEMQGLVDERTSVSELFLTVYGSDSVKQLADQFRQEGFSDVPTQWAGGDRTISWLRKMGFGGEFAGRRNERQEDEFVVPGAVRLNPLHSFQEDIRRQLSGVLTNLDATGRRGKAMVELPTGAGKTRVACETVLRLFISGELEGPVLWIAQSQELCEQAVQTWSYIWRGLGDERPLTVGRLWDSRVVHEPDTEFSVIVATDAQLLSVHEDPEYAWLRSAAAVIVDEGHRAGESRMYTRLFEWLGVAGRQWERPLVGLSATPFKGRSTSGTESLVARFGRKRLSAFEGNPYPQLAELGILARVEHQVLNGVQVALDADEIREARSQRRVSSTVLERIGQDQQRLAVLADHVMSQDESWPILVFTPSVLSAQVLAATLRYRGRTAAAVSGQTGRQERRDHIENFKRGKVQVLTNCDLLIQGFDAPGVRALYIARPTFSPNAYIQMAGRGLRGPENGGKAECLIVDMADKFGEVDDLLGYREYEQLWREGGE